MRNFSGRYEVKEIDGRFCYNPEVKGFYTLAEREIECLCSW